MAQVQEILRTIKSLQVSNRVRIKDFFADYDGLHSGTVTRSQFNRVLNICRFSLSQDQINQVCDHYVVNGLPDKVRYSHFCDDIESVFTLKNLEKSPTKPVELDTSVTGHVSFGLELTPSESEQLLSIVEKCSSEAKTRGIIVKSFFKDFDKRNSGFVTESQFRREVQNTFPPPLLNTHDTDILVKKYGHYVGAIGGGGKPLIEINYRSFHSDLSEVQLPITSSSHGNTYPSRKTDSVSNHALITILDSITRQVKEKRLRLKDFFKDFDTLRTGYVTPSIFKRALQFANLKAVTDLDVSLICDRFSINGKVCYKDFINEVDSASALDQLERKPTLNPASHAIDVAKFPRREIQRLSDIEEKELSYVIAPIKESIRQKRISLLEKFEDFDRQHEESVSSNQFDRVLSEFSLLPTKTSNLDLLHRKFSAVPSATGGIGSSFTGTFGPRIDYKLFLKSVNDRLIDDEKKSVEGSNASPLEPITQEKQEAVPFSLSRVSLSDNAAADELLAIVKRKVIEKRIRIREYLTDGDKLRHGSITFSQFFRALDIAGMGLNKEESSILASKYAHGSIKDFAGVPHVLWMDFADDVDSVFVVKNLEKAPTEDVISKINESIKSDSAIFIPRLSNSEMAALKSSIEEIKVIVSKRRIEITPAFEDFDWHSRGYIPASQFKRALSSLRIADNIPSSSIELICRAFEVPAVDHRCDVNYKWFVASLEGDKLDVVLSSISGKGEPLKNLSSVGQEGSSESKVTESFSPKKKSAVQKQDVLVNDLLLKMKDTVLSKNVRVSMFLEDYDKLRHGHISSAKFRTALSAAGFVLSEGEYECLEAKFAFGDGTVGRIDWKSLSLYLDGGGDNLERNPRNIVERSKRSVSELDSYNNVDKAKLNVVLSKCRDYIHSHNSLPKPYFQARDFNHQGLVSASQFRSVLDFLNLSRGLKEAEVDLLIKAFKSSKANNTDKVDYVRFCQSFDMEMTL